MIQPTYRQQLLARLVLETLPSAVPYCLRVMDDGEELLFSMIHPSNEAVQYSGVVAYDVLSQFPHSVAQYIAKQYGRLLARGNI